MSPLSTPPALLDGDVESTAQWAERSLRRLPPYRKMLESYRAMVGEGEYRGLARGGRLSSLFMLDNVNYATSVVPDPLPMADLLSCFEVEPSYATVTGDHEIGPLVRALEVARAERCARRLGADASGVQGVLAGTTVVATAGASGAAATALTSALARARSGRLRTSLVFNAPCYCLPEQFARTQGLTPRAVVGERRDGFLPSLDEVRAAVGHETLACFLTFPANPFLASWDLADADALSRLIEHCQALEVLLVVDSVFQDLGDGSAAIPEVFALADRPDHLVKLHSPSKDRPLACGYRTGYLIGDAALEPWLHQAEALAKNSACTWNLVWLAFDLAFRRAMLRGEPPSPSDFEPLAGRYLFGYGAPSPSGPEICRRVADAGLFESYAARVGSFQRTVRSDLARAHAWLDASRCFDPAPVPAFGNLLAARVRPPYELGSEEAFFVKGLTETGVTTTVGGCFGLPREHGVWMRVAVGNAGVETILAKLARLEEWLLSGEGEGFRLTQAGSPRSSAAPSRPGRSRQSLAPAGPRVTRAELAEDGVRVVWEGGEEAVFHPIWLRDNCPCPDCVHPEALERTFDLLSVPGDVTPRSASATTAGALEVLWPGEPGHRSAYGGRWLLENRHAAATATRSGPAPRFWAPPLSPLPALSYEALMEDDSELERLGRLLLEVGVAVVPDAPPTVGEVARVAGRIGHVWTHTFGEIFEVRVKADTDSSAYTALALPPHTDLPSRAAQPGFQFLHCVENSAAGGEFFLVDGFRLAAELRGSAPDLYATLSETPVEFAFLSRGMNHSFRGPILSHDPEGTLVSVRFNSFLQAPVRLPFGEVPRFYEAYRAFLELASDPAQATRMRFRPGHLIAFDNRRMLHGRDAFKPGEGTRFLQGCYLEGDEIASRVRMLAGTGSPGGSR